ncbi:MAG: peptidase S9, partial [Nitrospinota bacterium]
MTFVKYAFFSLLVLGQFFNPAPLFSAGVDGRFRFSTVETDHFTIHFHQGLERLARRTGHLAEVYHSVLTDIFRWTPKEKTQIVLLDNSDFSNASATIIPYNMIRIRTVPPSIDSTLGEYDDWLKELIVHEYTHILTLDSARGYSKALRYIFGKPLPVFSDIFSLAGALTITPPKFFLPSWWKEGIATWAETEFTDAGRGKSSWFEMIFRTAVFEDALPGIDEINGESPDWPAGKMPYIFGLALFKYVSDVYGHGGPGELSYSHSGRYPYFLHPLPPDSFPGKTYTSLYREMVFDLKKAQKKQIEKIKERPLSDVQVLPAQGEFLLYPGISSDGKHIAVTRNDPKSHKAVVLLRRDGTPAGVSFDRDLSSNSLSWSGDGKRIFFSQGDVVNGFNIYEDIFSFTLKEGKVRAVTKGLRVKDPDVRPVGEKKGNPVFAAVAGRRGGQNLVLVEKDLADSEYRANPLTNYSESRVANPRWSPDGRFIAYEMRGNKSHGGIHIYDFEKRTDAVAYEGKFSLAHPVWSPDGAYVVFVSDETGVFNLFALRVKDKKLYQVTNVTGGIFHPHISPEGNEILFSTYHAGGMKIGKMSFTPEQWWETPGPVIQKTWKGSKEESKTQARINEALLSSESRFVVDEESLRPYSPMRTLLPRFWIPSLIEDHTGLGGGFFTAGSDAVGYNSYFLRAEYVPESGNVYYDAAYKLDSFYPSFIFSSSALPVRYTSFFTDDYYEVNKSSSLQIVVPLNRIDSNYSFTLGYHFQEQSALSPLTNNRFQGLSVFQGTRDNIFLGLGFSNVEKYPYSISFEKGRSLLMLYRYFSSRLRSGQDSREYILSYEEFLPSPFLLKNHAFQFRLKVAASEGEQTAQHSFQIGGHGGESVFSLRGYPPRSFRGQYLATASLEYRFPIQYILKG